MGNHHHHHPTTEIKSINTAFIIGIVLNLIYVFIQLIIGLVIHSLALLSDAGHNFLDVAGLALAMLAFKLASSKSTNRYTYGYKKASILISLINAVVLLVSIGAIAYEAIIRFANPTPIPGKIVAIIAFIGIIINGVSAFMFFRDKEKDINIKSAFLHLAADALVSLGLVIGGVLIYFTHQYWIDPLLSIIICIIIVTSTFNLLKDSWQLSLDGVPKNIDIEKVKITVLQMEGVIDIHHIHIWAMSTAQNAMTGHIVFDSKLDIEAQFLLKNKIKHDLFHLNIHHVTLETEIETQDCKEFNC